MHLYPSIHTQWSVLYDRLGNANSLLRLAAISPEIFASGLGGPMAEDLKEGEGAPADARAGPIAALLCAWGRTEEVRKIASQTRL